MPSMNRAFLSNRRKEQTSSVGKPSGTEVASASASDTMPTSVLSLFGSSSQPPSSSSTSASSSSASSSSLSSSSLSLESRRAKAMRNAEASLVSFARRYDDAAGEGGVGHDQAVEVLDTRIPRSSVPLATTASSSIAEIPQCHCSFFPLEAMQRDDDDDDDGQGTGGNGNGGGGGGGGDDYLTIHGIKVTFKSVSAPASSESTSPLVLLHGYANGALYFFRNMLSLARRHYGTVYCLDLLGWGLSSRPPFRTEDDSVESAESVFVESLEAWRDAIGLEKMTLGGHSMGGLLSVAYCEKYSHRVDRLILLSPVGVPHGSKDSSGRRDVPLTYQVAFGLARYFFEYGLTPSSFIRSLPESSGRVIVEGYVDRRLPFITCPEEKSALTEYLYLNAVLPGSGEDCLNRLLTPMARARKPAIDRIPGLNVRSVSFIYGEYDWMDPSGGLEAQKLCAERRASGRPTPDVSVYGVKKAGHLLLLENWDEFNSAVILAGGGDVPADRPRPEQFVYSEEHNFFKRPSVDHQDQESVQGGKRAEIRPVGASIR